MKMHEQYIVLFDPETREQIKYFDYSGKSNLINDLPSSWKEHPNEFIKLVPFNPHTAKCKLDDNANFIIIQLEEGLSRRVWEEKVNLEHSDMIKTVQMTISVLLKSKLVMLEPTYWESVQENWDFNWDELYDEFLEKVKQVKEQKK